MLSRLTRVRWCRPRHDAGEPWGNETAALNLYCDSESGITPAEVVARLPQRHDDESRSVERGVLDGQPQRSDRIHVIGDHERVRRVAQLGMSVGTVGNDSIFRRISRLFR